MARPIVPAMPADVMVVSRVGIMEKIAENYLAFFSWNLPVCSNLFPGNGHFQIKFGMVANMVRQTMQGGGMDSGNLYGAIPPHLTEEIFQRVASGKGTRIEKIVSKGHCSPPGFWYDQAENEWVVVLKGEARLRFERDDRLVHLVEGGYVNIPAHEKHRVEWTMENTETIWLAVFY